MVAQAETGTVFIAVLQPSLMSIVFSKLVSPILADTLSATAFWNSNKGLSPATNSLMAAWNFELPISTLPSLSNVTEISVALLVRAVSSPEDVTAATASVVSHSVVVLLSAALALATLVRMSLGFFVQRMGLGLSFE